MEWGVCIIKCMPPDFVYSRCILFFFLITKNLTTCYFYNIDIFCIFAFKFKNNISDYEM